MLADGLNLIIGPFAKAMRIWCNWRWIDDNKINRLNAIMLAWWILPLLFNSPCVCSSVFGFDINILSLAESLTNRFNCWWLGQIRRWSDLWSSSWWNDCAATFYYWRYLTVKICSWVQSPSWLLYFTFSYRCVSYICILSVLLRLYLDIEIWHWVDLCLFHSL